MTFEHHVQKPCKDYDSVWVFILFYIVLVEHRGSDPVMLHTCGARQHKINGCGVERLRLGRPGALAVFNNSTQAGSACVPACGCRLAEPTADLYLLGPGPNGTCGKHFFYDLWALWAGAPVSQQTRCVQTVDDCCKVKPLRLEPKS